MHRVALALALSLSAGAFPRLPSLLSSCIPRLLLIFHNCAFAACQPSPGRMDALALAAFPGSLTLLVQYTVC